ncbi:MAG TPA: response regulator [Verrucomicrobiae bacterium]|jgi:CheY-like chemotaxis protein|nr:response regulator [Verrucomicrobiae bacterium]
MATQSNRNCILIVDDEPQIRDVMGMMLSEEGYRILTACDGQEALEVLKDKKPDLILLDMNMPRMGGIVFYHNIANSYDGTPKYPLLVLTARAHLEDLFKDFKVDGFMSKPFKFEDLMEQIEKILARRYGADGKLLPFAAGPQQKKITPKALVLDDQWEKFNAIVTRFMHSGYEVLAGKTERLTLQIASLDQPQAIFVRLKSLSLDSPEIVLAQAIRNLEKAKSIPILFYLQSDLKVFPSAREEITAKIPHSEFLDSPEPDVLLRAFEKNLTP